MFNNYGEIILKKNSILYHTSDNIFNKLIYEEYPILSCVFHPCEWYKSNKYITFIKLKRDISLFFMLDFKDIDKNNNKTIRVLEKIIDKNLNYINIEINKDALIFISQNLKKNNLDGWISPQKVEKGYIEIALINNPKIFKIKTERLKPDWTYFCNSYNNLIKEKSWGNRYPICSIKIPIVLNLNKRYKKEISKYMNQNLKFPLCFHILLNNAEIILL